MPRSFGRLDSGRQSPAQVGGGKAHTVMPRAAGPKREVKSGPEGGRRGAGLPREHNGQPDSLWSSAKPRLLGPPLVNEQLGEQRLSKPLALGVLSPDGISSSAYGTEEILIVLVPAMGVAAFSLILPMTLFIFFVIVLLLLSYP